MKAWSLICFVPFFSAAAATQTSGQEVKIVVPNQFADTEGELTTGPDIRYPIKSQEVLPAEEFASLPASHRWITGMALRPDENASLPRSTTYGDVQYRLSTTTAETLDELSNVFTENVGPDETLVFNRSPFTIAADELPDPGAPGPRDFDYVVEFDTPFFYDPTSGRNLLIELRTKSGYLDIAPILDAQGDANAILIYALDAEAPEATFRFNFGTIRQFSFVPEGDYSGNGLLDVADVDQLVTAIRAGKMDQQFDLNHNGTVDLEDHAYWVSDLKHTWMGDANLDGNVSFADFVSLADHFDGPGGWGQGDFDADGTVQFPDFSILASNYGMTSTTVAAAVPEPCSAVLLIIGVLLRHVTRGGRCR